VLPVVALVGRPNVGKSTLFNLLTRTRDALVADVPGLTRDRQYGFGKVGPCPYVVIDTGGLGEDSSPLGGLMAKQTQLALEEADRVLFMVDAREGLTPVDQEIAAFLRKLVAEVTVVINKAEGQAPEAASADFHALGFERVYAVSATHGSNVANTMEEVLAGCELQATEDEEQAGDEISVAIVGRPNVGKSTLINRLVGKDRLLAFDEPGTTRDSVFVPFESRGVRYELIDTAGVRRRSRVTETVEKFSIVKTLQAVDRANVVIGLLDAHEGITDQDASLLGLVIERGRAVLVVINKWDGLSEDQKAQVRRQMDLKLPFLEFAREHRISALHGTGLRDLLPSVNKAYAAAFREMATPELTRTLADAVNRHPPPLSRGRRIKLRYAHQGGKNPPLIVIHGNQTERIPKSYRRYLTNRFRQAFDLQGTPVRIEFRTGKNPYAGRRNTPTDRQKRRRKRLLKHVK